MDEIREQEIRREMAYLKVKKRTAKIDKLLENKIN